MTNKAQVKKQLEERGLSLTEWAMSHNIPPQVVTDLLNGKTKGKRGMSRKAMQLLGLKRAA